MAMQNVTNGFKGMRTADLLKVAEQAISTRFERRLTCTVLEFNTAERVFDLVAAELVARS